MDLTGKDIAELENSIPRDEYITNEMYYAGDNRKILDQANKRKPDNRVPIAFANRIIKNLAGYAARIGDLRLEVQGDEAFEAVYESIQKANNTDILNSRLYKNTLKHGISFDMVWTEQADSGIEIKVADIPIGQCLPLWDDELSVVKKLSKFVRYFDIPYAKEHKGDVLQAGHYAQVFDKGFWQLWFLRDFNQRQGQTQRDPYMVDEQEQPFDRVQVNAFFANDEKIPYWLPIKNIIDQYDKIISGNMNEADRFNDTWLMFMQKITPDTKRKIDEMGIIDGLSAVVSELVGSGDAYPRFLERNIPVEHSKMMLDALENDLYTIIGAPSFLDENLGAASGVSLLIRLIGLEYSACETDTYFDMGLMGRFELIKQALKASPIYDGQRVSVPDEVTTTIKHKRNIPIDKASILKEALDMFALGISKETILRYLPREIIPDLEAELANEEASAPALDVEEAAAE